MSNGFHVVDLLACGGIIAVAVVGLLRRFLSDEPTTPCLVQRGGAGTDEPALVQIGRARRRP